MTLRLTLISPDVEDFIIEMKIDADASFADLHNLILNQCGYKEIKGQRFLICDENWRPYRRILLSDEGNTSIDEDVYLMADTDLGEVLEDEGQRLTYRYDPEGHRMFLLEVTKITFGDKVPAEGIMTRRSGHTPAQFLQEEAAQPNIQMATEALEEEFYGDEGFEEEDLDMDGFDIMD